MIKWDDNWDDIRNDVGLMNEHSWDEGWFIWDSPKWCIGCGTLAAQAQVLTTLVMLFSEPVSSGGPKAGSCSFTQCSSIFHTFGWFFGAIPPMEILWNRQNILRISLSQRSFSHFQTLLVILDDASEMLSTDQGQCWLTFKTSMAMAIPSLVEMYRNVTPIYLAFKTVHFLMAYRLAGYQKSSSHLCLAA